MVNFKVARMNNRTNGRIYCNGNRIGDAVIYADKIQLKGTGSNLVTGLNSAAIVGAHAVFLQTPLQNA